MANLNPNIIKQSIKRPIKRLIQTFAANFGHHTRKPAQPELLILMYHRILPADDPRSLLEEPGMMVTPDTFEMQMKTVKSLFATIHLSDWPEQKNSSRPLPQRCCAITFDDGWVDNYEFAYPILEELGIQATIFLVSDMVGEKHQFWPERLAHILSTIAQRHPTQWTHPSLDWIKQYPSSYGFTHVKPSQEQISEIIAGAKSLSDDEIHRRLDDIEQQLKLTISDGRPSLLNWQQIKIMCESGLIEVGSHTCHHTRLTDEKTTSVLHDEVVNSKTLIEEKTGTMVKTFCFPNGDYSDAALSMVRQHYNSSVTTKSGWNTNTSDNFLLRRIGVHEDISNDKTSFLSCISGWL
jgi:peptidoglycan/xylan/chitin deacetylase (PgdA/CDA1 family)